MDDKKMKQIASRYPEMISEPFDKLYADIGFDALCALCDFFGGTMVYVPKKRKLFKDCVRNALLNDYRGQPIQEMCREYGICETTVRGILFGR